MISALIFNKPATATLLVFAIAALVLTENASAQAPAAVRDLADSEVQPPQALNNILPAELMRGSGQWIGNLSFTDIPMTAPPAKVNESIPWDVKSPAPGWLSTLDFASYFLIPMPNATVVPKPYNPAPRVNDPKGPPQ